MNILIFGHVCIDNNISENSTFTGPGSAAMFMQKALRQFHGCKITVVAPYGSDYLPYLKDINIYPPQPNEPKTLIYENNTKQGLRTQKAHNRGETEPIKMDQNLENLIAQANVIFYAPLLPNISGHYIRTVNSFARADAIKVLVPQGYFRQFDLEDNVLKREFMEEDTVLPNMDIVIASEDDYKNMDKMAESWAKKYPLIAVVTKGAKSGTAYQNDKIFDLPTRLVEEKNIVDSIGCGDIFSGSFAYRYYQTRDIEDAGRFANEVARQRLFQTTDKIKIDLKKIKM